MYRYTPIYCDQSFDYSNATEARGILENELFARRKVIDTELLFNALFAPFVSNRIYRHIYYLCVFINSPFSFVYLYIIYISLLSSVARATGTTSITIETDVFLSSFNANAAYTVEIIINVN